MPAGSHSSASQVSSAVAALQSVAAVTLALASVVHLGVVIPLGLTTVRDPFMGAAIPEAVLAIALGAGVLGVLTRWTASWPLALGTGLFALLGVLYGLTVTVGGPRTGDVAYHFTLLGILVVTVAVLLTPAGRRALRAS
jgi:hypothetical protein